MLRWFLDCFAIKFDAMLRFEQGCSNIVRQGELLSSRIMENNELLESLMEKDCPYSVSSMCTNEIE